jgi:hypothetical protein
MSLDALLRLPDDLVEQIADQVELKLAERLAAQETPRVKPLTTDELIDELPRTKTPEQWRRWLQVNSQKGRVPGAVKLGGAWCYLPDETIAWIEGRQ